MMLYDTTRTLQPGRDATAVVPVVDTGTTNADTLDDAAATMVAVVAKPHIMISTPCRCDCCCCARSCPGGRPTAGSRGCRGVPSF